MRNAFWAVLCLGCALGFADEPQTRKLGSGPLSPVPDPSSHVEVEKVLQMKRVELKELESKIIDELDEASIDRRLQEARRGAEERKAADQLNAIADQLSKLADAYPKTNGGQRAKRALDALRSPIPIYGDLLPPPPKQAFELEKP
jgi:hypothetical protein